MFSRLFRLTKFSTNLSIPKRNYGLNFEHSDSVRLDRLEKKFEKVEKLISPGWVYFWSFGSGWAIGSAIGSMTFPIFSK